MEKNETSKNEKIVKKSETPSNVIFFMIFYSSFNCS